MVANNEIGEPTPLPEEALLPPAVEVPAQRVVASGLWGLTVLLAFVGGAAVLIAVGLVLVANVFRAGDPGLKRAVSSFTNAARALPGVRAATAKPGLGDLGTTPKDIYGDVRMDSACTIASLATTTERLRAIMARDRPFLLHPTVWCNDRGLTVSPIAAVTKQRLAVVGRLAEDRSLNAAALVVTQRGDDPSPDRDNDSVQLDLYVHPRSSAALAHDWLNRARRTLPDVTVTATSEQPGEYLDVLALQNGQWTVAVQAQDPQNAAILRTAARLERSPTVLGAYFDGPRRQAAIISSTWNVLQDLRDSLPRPEADDQPLRLAVTIARRPSR